MRGGALLALPATAQDKGAASGATGSKNVVLTGEMQVLDPDNKVVAAALATGRSDKAIEEKQKITWKELQSITDITLQAAFVDTAGNVLIESAPVKFFAHRAIVCRSVR